MAKSKPILEAFHTFLKDIQPNVQPKGLLHKAVQYTLNQWDALTLFLTDGKIDVDKDFPSPPAENDTNDQKNNKK